MTTIQAELRNHKPMVSQPYMQIILSVPAEQAQQVIATLGYPTPGESIWVEISLIEEKPPFIRNAEYPNA